MLKVSTKGRYGLRAMVQLAHAWEQGPLEMSTIAKSQEISRKYLHSLLHCLKQAGLAESKRGVAGGYMLSRPPKDIQVLQVFEALEGKLCIVGCTTDPTYCARQPNCPAVDLWKRLNSTIKHVLQDVTLQDLVHQDSRNLSESFDKEVVA